jgi:hypothetical protein
MALPAIGSTRRAAPGRWKSWRANWERGGEIRFHPRPLRDTVVQPVLDDRWKVWDLFNLDFGIWNLENALLITHRMFSKRLLLSGFFVVVCAMVSHAQSTMQFKLVNGAILNGQPLTPKDSFVLVKLDNGTYTNLNWVQISQETLRELEKNKSFAAYANIFIDPEPSSRRAAPTAKAVTIKPVPRIDRPAGGSLLASPVMLVALLLVYAANIYAAYEIAMFRQQPPALVCVVAGVIPVLGPILFLAMPTRQPKQEVVWEAPVEQAPVEEAPPAVEEQPETANALHVAQPAIPPPVVYPRGQFTFNRRFFETKFAGFLKMVPGEAERDKVIQIKSARGEYTGQRLTKIEPNELYLQIRKGNATEDVMIPFSEIFEVTVKHKDA